MTAPKVAAHTPGPWYAEPDGSDSFRVKSDDHGGIAFIHDPLARQLRRTTELRANAALIAAAPDLLAALEEMVAASELYEPASHEAIAAARAAIAKAQP